MIAFLYKLFNHDKIDRLNERLKTCDETIQSLEEEVREYKSYKLKYRVTKLYVEDDEALLELFEIAESNEKAKSKVDSQYLALRQQAVMNGLGSSAYASGLAQQQAGLGVGALGGAYGWGAWL